MDLKSYIKDVPDFPKAGIVFKDITPLLLSPVAFNEVINRMAEALKPFSPQKICGIESRGFIFAAPLAQKLKLGFVPIRKPGKLPGAILSHKYQLEYGFDELQVKADAFLPSERVVIVDDVLATGGTMEASCALVHKAGGQVVSIAFLMELAFLNGKEKLVGHPLISVLTYS